METRFADFEGLCRLEASETGIDWDDPAVARLLPDLKRLKLVALKLV